MPKGNILYYKVYEEEKHTKIYVSKSLTQIKQLAEEALVEIVPNDNPDLDKIVKSYHDKKDMYRRQDINWEEIY